eukprot:11525751-Alexandrium_andersonii.AAC.1
MRNFPKLPETASSSFRNCITQYSMLVVGRLGPSRPIVVGGEGLASLHHRAVLPPPCSPSACCIAARVIAALRS